MKGPDGKISKTTNFSKDQWEEISDMHVRDVWAVHGERDKILLIEGAIRNAVDLLRSRKYIKKRKADEREIERLAKKARGSGYQHPIAASDSDIWFVSNHFDVCILILFLDSASGLPYHLEVLRSPPCYFFLTPYHHFPPSVDAPLYNDSVSVVSHVKFSYFHCSFIHS